MTIGDIATVIMALATTGSLLYITRQVNVTRLQTKGQFLLALDDQFEKANVITARLLNEQNFTPVGNDWPEVWRLMSIFERINIMVEDNILDIGIIDRLHGFRLLGIIGNETVYQRIAATGAEWQDFIDLCYAIADYRQHNNPSRRDEAFIERVRKLDKNARKTRNPFLF